MGCGASPINHSAAFTFSSVGRRLVTVDDRRTPYRLGKAYIVRRGDVLKARLISKHDFLAINSGV